MSDSGREPTRLDGPADPADAGRGDGLSVLRGVRGEGEGRSGHHGQAGPRAAHEQRGNTAMIERIIEWSIRNRFLVLILATALSIGGVFAVFHTPMDAIPDL